MLERSAYVDPFTRERVDAIDPFPALTPTGYPARLNAGALLLDGKPGDAIAIVTDSALWTYTELTQRADQVAHLLTAELGLVTGGRVLVSGPNTPWFVACVLGTWRAGGVVVAHAPAVPARETRQMIDIARVDWALLDHRSGLDLDDLRTMRFGDDDWLLRLDKHVGPFATVDTAADDVAMIQFTSGTTGAPKGVLHFHRDVITMADGVGGGVLSLAPGERLISNRAMGFGYAFGALIPFTLRHGAASVLVEDNSPNALFEAVVRHQVDVALSTPSTYRAGLAGAAPADLGRLRLAVSGGEPLPEATIASWWKRYGTPIVNLFGSTELTHAVLGSVDAPPGSAGQPVPGYTARVTRDGVTCISGEPGDLEIQGPTGCRYLDHPHQRVAVRDGWTYTGDVAHLDADGNVFVHGRADDLIIIDSGNVAPAEVENVLLGHPAVSEAIVVGVPGPDTTTLRAYLTLTQPADDLPGYLAANLTFFKVPREIEVLDAMPRTAIGKVDRRALRDRAGLPPAGARG